MNYLLLVSLALISIAIDVKIEISKSELRTILIPLLKKLTNNEQKFNFDYKINAGIGKLEAKKMELKNFVIDEDSVQIKLLEDSNYIKINGIIEYFIADIDIDVSTIVGNLKTNTASFEVIGVEVECSFRIINNVIELQNQKFDKLVIKQFKLKSGDGLIEKAIKSVFNQILDTFQRFIEEQGLKKIQKILTSKELPLKKYHVNQFTIMGSEKLSLQLELESLSLMNSLFPQQ